MNNITSRLAKKLSKKFNMADMYFHISPGDTVIDIGACTGDMTYYYSWKVGDKGRVIAVEPSPIEMKRVEVVTHNLKNVTLIQNAIYKESGIQDFYLSSDPSHNSLYKNFDWLVEHEAITQKISIKAITMDDLTKDLKTVNLITMNIEGAEYDALLGASRTLSELSPKLNIYVHDEADKDKIASILHQYNYNIRYKDSYLYASKNDNDFKMYQTYKCDICNNYLCEFENARFDGVCKMCYLTFLKSWLDNCLT